jgi:GR25 family glycosyltransferase involved in LPS biosynthesis
MTDPNKLVFVPSGRLGNAIFRYIACAVVNIVHPTLHYTLATDIELPIDNLTYYAGLDHVGDDVYQTNASASEMAKEAKKNNNILGYNTLGFFKDSIDLNRLTSNMYINKENGQGLYVKKTITLTDENFFNMFYKKLKYFNVSMDGFFQFGYIYLKYKPQILRYLTQHKNEHFIQTDENERFLMRDLMDDIVLPSEKQYDIAIHIRLGDFNGRPDFIEFEHYRNLFESLLEVFEGKRICLIYQPCTNATDTAYINDCLKWFQEHAIPLSIESNYLVVDFNIMKQAAILICSMSTLSWAAAYLSTHIQTCYMPNYNFYGTERENTFFHKPITHTILYPVKTTPPIKIKTYIITLPEYSSRLEKLYGLNHQLALIGLDAELYQGVHGKDIHIYEAASKQTGIKHITWQGTTYFYNTRVRLNGEPMKRGEMGCVWSHLNVLRQFVAEKDAPDYYLILEDDVELVKPLDELSKLLAHIPADADICHLAKSDWNPFILKNKVNAYFYECEKAFFNRTTAYLISKKGAQKVLDYTKNSINVPIDDLFNMIYRLTPDFRFYVPAHHFFKEQDNVSLRNEAIYQS